MEKISLKPSVRELIYKNDEPGMCFDVSSYSGVSTQEKSLGSLYVLSQLKQKEEDLDYLVSLTSSLAKREYYSQESIAQQNPKIAFERTLKKLNEVLDDFFKNKNLTLNLGLAVIAGDTIYISRLGKFKVAMARNGEYIDILNNLQLFNKEDGDEKKFANIISGKLRANDKIFAYFPHRAITSREKLLNPIFISQGQEEFTNKLAQLAANVSNFSCCGLHIDIKEIKEIPVQAMSVEYSTPMTSPTPVIPISQNYNQTVVPEKIKSNDEVNKPIDTAPISKNPNQIENINRPTAGASVIRAELSVSKRSNFLTDTFNKLIQFIPSNQFKRPKFNSGGKLLKIGMITKNNKLRFFLAIALVVILPLAGWVIIKNKGSSHTSEILKSVNTSLGLARSNLAQNNSREARNLVKSALAQLNGLQGKQIDIARNDISKTLNSIDYVSDKQPELLYNSTGQDLKLRKINLFSGNASIFNEDGKLYSLNNGSLSEVGKFNKVGGFLMAGKDFIASFNSIADFEVYSLKTKKISAYSLKNQLEYSDVAIYEGNLYAINAGKIDKYSDVVTGGIKGVAWGDVSDAGTIVALAADGNIYILNTDGKVTKYFKGKKDSELDLQIKPSSSAKIWTDKNSAFIYLIEKEDKKVYVYDKTSGTLKTSYKLDVVGDIQDISISSDGTILILSKTNNIWQIKP